MFLKSVRAFYIRAMEYSLANLSLNDDLLINATFVNIPSREQVRLEYFVNLSLTEIHMYASTFMCRYNHLLPYRTPEELEQLSEEFSIHQVMEDNEIPQGIWDAKEDNGKCYYRMDILWHFLSTLENARWFSLFLGDLQRWLSLYWLFHILMQKK